MVAFLDYYVAAYSEFYARGTCLEFACPARIRTGHGHKSGMLPAKREAPLPHRHGSAGGIQPWFPWLPRRRSGVPVSLSTSCPLLPGATAPYGNLCVGLTVESFPFHP
jgi:hypothetical protein